MGVRRTVVALAAAALALTGCGDVSPGAAGTVDGEAIELVRVDDLARSLCAAEVTYADITGNPFEPRPTSTYRANALSVLVNETLAEQAVDELGLDVPPSAYEPPEDAELTRLYDALDTEDADAFRDYIDSLSRLQAYLVAIGEEVGEQSAGDDQAAATAGTAWLAEYAESRDVELDPRFGDFTGGQVVGGSGSLSVPVAGEDPADAPDVAGLPDSQICQ